MRIDQQKDQPASAPRPHPGPGQGGPRGEPRPGRRPQSRPVRQSIFDRPDLLVMAATTFVLCGMPRLRAFPVGPPLYAIDFMIMACWVFVLIRPPRNIPPSPLTPWVLTIGGFVMLCELVGIIVFGNIVAPAYMLMRTGLGISLFFLLRRVITGERDVQVIAKAAVLGISVTAVIIIMVSLPTTRGIVTRHIFTIGMLEPASDWVVQHFDSKEGAIRGRSLVGVSNMSGAFLGIMWPLAIFLFRWPGVGTFWKWFAGAVAILCPIAATFTYSRGAILGLILVIGVMVLLGKGGGRWTMAMLVAAVIGLFSYVGWDSEMFFFERITNRVEAMQESFQEGVYTDERESERIDSYTEPFIFLAENPMHLFRGEGLAGGKLASRGELGNNERLFDQHERATHSAFAMTFYTYGLIAALCSVVLMVRAGLLLWGTALKSGRGSYISNFPGYLLASFAALIPWWMFGHGCVSQPRGVMMFYFVMGLVSMAVVYMNAGVKRPRPVKRPV